MKRKMHFRWKINEPPPQIEGHSKAKLEVFRCYLRSYFDRLNKNIPRDEFRLTLVDGFAGGGEFLDNNDTILGSPLIMLEESALAEERLNEKRKKRLRINCKYYFIDKNSDHTDYLKAVLKKRGYPEDERKIIIQNSSFADVADRIIQDIHKRHPRTGRAIFLLDQSGFSDVDLNLVSNILQTLPTAEIILTYAADALINFYPSALIQKTNFPQNFEQADTKERILSEDSNLRRAMLQRSLKSWILSAVPNIYFTPFFIRPTVSRRALWFMHFSRHPTARDVMLQHHWDISNTFEHYGSGGFSMLGWDDIARGDAKQMTFNFTESDALQMRANILENIPRELYSIISENPITVDAMHHQFANRTAARFSDLDEIVLDLVKGNEFEILGMNNKVRSHNIKQLKPTDRIALSSTFFLPGFSRKR